MIQLPLAIRYGLEGMRALAPHYGLGYLRVEQVARRCGMPPEFLSKIFGRLAAQRLVESQRGPGGGYGLTREPKDIRIADILEALTKTVPAPRPCILGHRLCGTGEKTCPIHYLVVQTEEALSAKLGNMTLQDLAGL